MKVIDFYIQEGLFGPRTLEDPVVGEIRKSDVFWLSYVDIPPHNDISVFFKYEGKEGLNKGQQNAWKTIKKIKPVFKTLFKKCYDEILKGVDLSVVTEFRKRFPYKEKEFFITAASISDNPGNYILYVGWDNVADYWVAVTIIDYKFQTLWLDKFGVIYNMKKYVKTAKSFKSIPKATKRKMKLDKKGKNKVPKRMLNLGK